ncbi:MAG: type II toxin-antitoxin system HicA family toxin [Candidatus Vogelbacteria bacterium]|nr:type II toxin-antitoxin system HicA family toxin [Candidatus Vogelbacteria bacterium]
MPKLPVIRTRQLIEVLRKLGFYKHHQVGSHAQFKNFSGQRITVIIHSRDQVGRKTLKGIITDLHLTVEEFIGLL